MKIDSAVETTDRQVARKPWKKPEVILSEISGSTEKNPFPFETTGVDGYGVPFTVGPS